MASQCHPLSFGTPRSASHVSIVWRSVFGVAPSIRASLQAAFQAVLIEVVGRTKGGAAVDAVPASKSKLEARIAFLANGAFSGCPG